MSLIVCPFDFLQCFICNALVNGKGVNFDSHLGQKVMECKDMLSKRSSRSFGAAEGSVRSTPSRGNRHCVLTLSRGLSIVNVLAFVEMSCCELDCATPSSTVRASTSTHTWGRWSWSARICSARGTLARLKGAGDRRPREVIPSVY